MLYCLLVWLLAAGGAWLVGKAALRVAYAAGFSGLLPDPPVVILFGLCCIAVLGGVWSLVAPLRAGAVAAGVILLALSAVSLHFLPQGPHGEIGERRHWWEISLVGLVVMIAAAQSASPVSVYDTGLYHLQAIRWIERYPAVPGLANLHERLAFSAPWFEAQALFDPSIFGGRSVFALNGMVFVTAVCFFLDRFGNVSERLTLSRILRWGCVPAAFWLMRRGLSSASPDGMVALLSWIVLLLLAEKMETVAAATLDISALVITVLAAFAAVTKLSAAPLVLAPVWLVLSNLQKDRRRALVTGAIAGAVAAPFIVRSVIVSGYWWFPTPWTRVPGLAWTVPAEVTTAQVAKIQNWARLPNRPPVAALDLAAWVPTWAHNLSAVDRLFLVALPVLGLIHVALVFTSKRRAPSWPAGYSLLTALSLTGTLFWLITAPDPRFGWGSFPFLALLLAAPLLYRSIHRLPRWAIALALGVMLLDQGRRVIAQGRKSLEAHWLWPPIPPVVETRTVVVDGLSVYIPTQGEQCWDAPLPCTPSVDPLLGASTATLESGFFHRMPPAAGIKPGG